ncbi:MAG: helix-turn-helix domain-containing protein, partial [Nitrospira sp. CR2.1]|nr:helix-turn-helix domain-containing protein [Nitrospira sp. CR2.1]
LGMKKDVKEPQGGSGTGRKPSTGFLADADSLNHLSTDTYGSPWAMWKSRWVFEAWQRAAGGQWHRQQSDYYLALRKAFEIYRDQGRIDERTAEGAIISLLRPGPISHFSVQDRMEGKGKQVDRSLAWTTGVRFTDPFYKLVGARLIVLIAEYEKKDENARFHTHLGEEFVFILEGKVELQWRVPEPDGKGFTTKSKLLDSKAAFPHNRSAWFKSECPHRALLLGDSATLLVFYSDPLGAIVLQPWFRTWSEDDKQLGLGSKFVETDAPVEREWAVFSGIGARIERARRMRGWNIKQLATLAGIEPSHLNRIEDGKITPSIETAAKLAANLDVPLSEILPDDIVSYIEGCYINPADPIWRMLTHESMPEDVRVMLSSKRKSENKDQRVQIPYVWKDYGELLVLPAGSPRAKSLLPVNLHISKSGKDGDQDIRENPARNFPRKVAVHNYKALVAHMKNDKLWSYASNLIVFVRKGNIRLRVCRFSDMQLFPFLGSQPPEEAAIWFETFELSQGDLVHLNCEHLHRFEVPSEGQQDYYCALLCVIGRRHVSDAIQTPTANVLEDVLPIRNDDLDFWRALQEHLRK